MKHLLKVKRTRERNYASRTKANNWNNGIWFDTYLPERNCTSGYETY
jgi:hypothetical protein